MTNHPATPRRARRIVATLVALTLVGALAAGLWFGAPSLFARDQVAQTQPSPLHPTFPLLDANGSNVLESGAAVSPMTTCGGCHDTTFIEQHSFHADLGLSDFGAPSLQTAQPWDLSRGLFGRWDPLTYRTLSAPDAERMDLTTAEWLMTVGTRAAGGGPATTSRSGEPLASLAPDAANPESSILAADGTLQPWDWQASGTLEMDCFLCHFANPDIDARSQAIAEGDFGWANTATLLSSGVVTRSADGYLWQPDAFDDEGDLKPDYVLVQDPTNENCASCHGVVHTDSATPLLLDPCDPNDPQTATTGQVVSAQTIAESGLNLEDKASLTRAWDVHAERAVKCTDCHYALNNPVHAQEAAGANPDHLLYDPRRLELGEYLERPDHTLARGASAQFTVDAEQKGSMRRCESCHAAQETHNDWLPYTERHLEELACESCHIPQMNAPALESIDWTVLTSTGDAVTACRGIEGDNAVTGLVTGFTPVLMQRTNVDGDTMLAPYNLLSSWYWTFEESDGSRLPVPLADLKRVYFDGDAYAADVVAAFDGDGDGSLAESELLIASPEQQELIAGRLATLGLRNVTIEGQVQPYSINHGVARDEWVTNDCEACHADNSLISAPFTLAAAAPGGVLPTFVSATNVSASGSIDVEDGALRYVPTPAEDGIYIFGHNRVGWIDLFGAIFFAGTLLAVGVHGTLRFISAMRRPQKGHALKRVYMYHAYERFWHWLQTVTILLLLFTGLIIHRPDIFGIFSFPFVVLVHNVLAAVLVVNASLSLFYHVVGGEIQQYIPRPYGFFDQAIEQTKFYLYGIFRGEPHPFAKSRERHLNPLQQITYFGILNVLLPLQIITGALMWGVQRWPTFAGALGGLPLLAPFHTLVAWMFASFIVAHVYLTTTGPEPLGAIRAMITGWDEVEDPDAAHAHPAVADAQPGMAHSTGD